MKLIGKANRCDLDYPDQGLTRADHVGTNI